MIRPVLALTILSLATPAFAQTTTGAPPKRIRSVTLTGNERCPTATSPDEVIVCSRIAPGERYRIPKEVRNEGPIEPQNQSFAAKQDRLDEVGRAAAGLPDSCSPVGTGGQTGCTKVMLDQSAEDRRTGNTNPPR